jgi:hypothetical protein
LPDVDIAASVTSAVCCSLSFFLNPSIISQIIGCFDFLDAWQISYI